MKPSNKTSIIFLSIGLLFTTFSNAQGIGNVKMGQSETDHYMNSELEPAENAKASFSTLFPNASQQKWSNSDGSSIVTFVNNGRKATASFSAKGTLNYVISTCSANDLPSTFSKNIRTNYAEYQLFHAIEIKAYGETAYQAILENDDEFVTLKFTTDGVEQLMLTKK